MELCGGTHVNRTGDIGFFHIIEESSLASGVRRIVALTGNGAVARMQSQAAILDELQRLLNIPPEHLPERIGTMIAERKKLEKRLRQRLSDSGSGLTKLLDQIETVKGHQVLVEKIEASSMDDLKRIGDEVRGKLTSGIGALFMAGDGKPSAVVVVADGIIAQGQNAGTLAKSIGSFMGGGGGGKPHLATAGGSDVEIIEQAMDQTKELILNCLTELE
jgi:alanyl-tRNA synthetase